MICAWSANRVKGNLDSLAVRKRRRLKLAPAGSQRVTKEQKARRYKSISFSLLHVRSVRRRNLHNFFTLFSAYLSRNPDTQSNLACVIRSRYINNLLLLSPYSTCSPSASCSRSFSKRGAQRVATGNHRPFLFFFTFPSSSIPLPNNPRRCKRFSSLTPLVIPLFAWMFPLRSGSVSDVTVAAQLASCIS